jgi:hypothetical protein
MENENNDDEEEMYHRQRHHHQQLLHQQQQQQQNHYQHHKISYLDEDEDSGDRPLYVNWEQESNEQKLNENLQQKN